MANALTLTEEEVRQVVDESDKKTLSPFLAVYAYDKKRDPYCACSCCRIGKYFESTKRK